MIVSNIHTHTVFSDGKNTIEENIESAVRKGFVLLGFSDHSYLTFDHSYTMRQNDYSDYIRAVRDMQEKYKDSMPIRLGIESDLFSDTVYSDYDYVIGAVHHVFGGGKYYAMDESADVQRQCVREAYSGNIFGMCRAYFENVCKAASLKPDILAHFDLVTKFGLIDVHDPKYRNTALEAVDEVLNYPDMLIEVNTGAMSRGYRNQPYPDDFILKRISERGGKVIIGSDSHGKDNIDYAFPVAIERIKAAGIKSVYQLMPEGFRETAI